MRLLHTADWHVGRAIRGRSRAAEHREVLGEIAEIAAREKADVVLVAGDLFDSAAPSPEAEEIVYQALLALADSGAQVVLVAGNHDHPRRLEAVKPLLERTRRVHAGVSIAPPEEGGVVELETASGELARLGLLPFLSQRRVVSALDLLGKDAGEHAGQYAEKCTAILKGLCEGFASDSVNVLVAHLMVLGAVAGGGERRFHMSDEYALASSAFAPSDAADPRARLHYVALGHVHRRQRIQAACPVWYCGSPLQLDFGETENEPGVLLVEAAPDSPAEARTILLEKGRRLRTLEGDCAALAEQAVLAGADFLRIIVEEAPRPGLGDEIRELFPNAVQVEIAQRDRRGRSDEDVFGRLHKPPRELFSEYLAEQDSLDERLLVLFDELLEEVSGEA